MITISGITKRFFSKGLNVGIVAFVLTLSACEKDDSALPNGTEANDKEIKANRSSSSRLFDWPYFEYGQFEPQFYRNKYSDELGLMTDEQLKYHWLDYGISEGRVASPAFDAHYFHAANNFGPIPSYLALHGLPFFEHRYDNTSPAFNYDYYVTVNSDLAQFSYYTAVNHWLNHGIREGRQAHQNFDPIWYYENNADLKAIWPAHNPDRYKYATWHWLNHGRGEGRPGRG